MNPHFSFKCPKCQTEIFKLGELRGPTGGFSAYANLDLGIFTTVTCTRCGFTELFEGGVDDFKRGFGLEGGPIFGLGPGNLET